MGLETVEDVNTKVVEANAIETVHTLLTSGVQYNEEHTTFVTIPLKEVHQWGIGKIREKVIELLRIGKDKRKSRGRIVQTIERRRNASVEKKRKKGLAKELELPSRKKAKTEPTDNLGSEFETESVATHPVVQSQAVAAAHEDERSDEDGVEE